MAGKMFKQAIDFTCEVAQGNLVNRGVDLLLDVLSGKGNSNSDLENTESNFNTLMARADDLEKDINIKEQQGRKRKREVEVWFEDVKRVEGEYYAFKNEEKGLMKQIFGGDEAIKLNAKIRDLDNRSQLFGELVLADINTSTTEGLPRPIKKLEGAAFQDNFKRIWSLLKNAQVSSIGVHGMGGVGKSTLVEHIHNRLLKRNKCVFWVVVSSQRCSIKMLQDKIATKLGLDLSEEDGDDEGARAGRLKHALSRRKNFILILDDVWEHFDLVKVGIPLSMKGCKWMMTSRSLNVCREMNCQENISVKPLREDEGWNLFLKNLGQDAASALRNPEVEGIGKRMVKVCDGLPLGISTLAGAVSDVTEIQEWRHELRVLEESVMGHEWMEEKVFPVLQYSFDRLNLNDQHCFLYCSLYPEDYVITMKELFRKFISEKLVDEKKSRAAQHDEIYSIVTRLVKLSLLERVPDWYGERVRMHDLVRGMAHKITEGKIMVIVGDESRKKIPIEEEWTEDLEKVSLMLNEIEEIPHGISPNCPKLTTLLLQQNYPLKRISTSFFTQMCGLRTLDLSETDIEELPASVSDLVNLTSLLLGYCRKLVHVPCVRKLKKLRELDLSDTLIEDVPQGMEELVRLRLLRLPWDIQAEFVEGRGEMLEVYEGGLKHLSDFNRLFASKPGAASYTILLGVYNIEYFDYWEYGSDDKELYVFVYDLKNESTTILAEYIQYLTFNLCVGMSKCLSDDLTNPESVEALTIENSKGTECILMYDQYNASHDSKCRFQALEVIVLSNLEEFTGVIHELEIEVSPSSLSLFPSLRRLDISRCNKMKKLGLPLSAFEKLEDITVKDCEEMEEIIEVGAAADDALLVSLPNLASLSLDGLPSLKSFCDALVICNILKYFWLKDCPRLEALLLKWGTPESYKPLFPGDGLEQIRRLSL